jgi:calcium release-activated calcium channel protein 1
MDVEQVHITRTPLKRRRLLFSKAKLKAVSRTSALLSGFAMVSYLFFLYVLYEYYHLNDVFFSIEQVAMVEISLDDHKHSKSSAPLLVVYSVITCLLVGVHLLALMISTCILPQLEADSLLGYEEYASHETMHIYIELAWILSTGFGIFLFLVEIAIVCWVKFYFVTRPAAIATTIVIVPVIILFCIFSLHFYRRLVSFKLSRHQDELNEIENTLTIGKLAQPNIV